MKRVKVEKVRQNKLSDTVTNILNSVSDIRVTSRLDDALAERGLSQSKLSMMTGIRQASISALATGENSSMNKLHLVAVMIALRITDIREIFDIQFDEATTKKFKEQAKDWVSTKSVPLEVVELSAQTMKKSLE